MEDNSRSQIEVDGQVLPEKVVVYERDEFGRLHKKTKRLVIKKKEEELSDIQKKEIDSAF